MNDRKEINEIKEGLKSLLDRLEKLEKASCTPCEPLKKKFLVKLPEDGERLYFTDNVQSTISSKIFDISNMNDVKRFENGLFFKSYKEAKLHLKERKLLLKLHQWAKEKNKDWEPDWNGDKNNKYYIQVDLKNNRFVIANTNWFSDFQKLPFFKSEKIAQECIDLFGDEIKEVLVNGS